MRVGVHAHLPPFTLSTPSARATPPPSSQQNYWEIATRDGNNKGCYEFPYGFWLFWICFIKIYLKKTNEEKSLDLNMDKMEEGK
jgi:hypothetical protein